MVWLIVSSLTYMRRILLVLLVVLLLTLGIRADILSDAACRSVFFVALSRDLIGQSQGQSALGMITAEEWEEQPEIEAADPGYCSHKLPDFGQGLSLLWQRDWPMAGEAFERSDRDDLAALGSYTAHSLLDETDGNMTAPAANYFLFKGDSFMRSGRPDIAGVYYQQSVKGYPTIEGWQKLARAYGEQGSPDQQIAALESVLVLEATDLETRYLLAMARFEEDGRAAEAKSQILDLINGFDPREPEDYVLLYKIYLALAQLDDTLGNKEGAIEWLTLAFDLPFVQTHQAGINMSRLYLDLGRFDDAWTWQRKVEALRPTDPQTYILGAELFEGQGKLAGAVSYYENAISLMVKPRVNTYIKLARIYEQTGRSQDARQLWQRVLEIDPGNRRAEQALEK